MPRPRTKRQIPRGETLSDRVAKKATELENRRLLESYRTDSERKRELAHLDMGKALIQAKAVGRYTYQELYERLGEVSSVETLKSLCLRRIYVSAKHYQCIRDNLIPLLKHLDLPVPILETWESTED